MHVRWSRVWSLAICGCLLASAVADDPSTAPISAPVNVLSSDLEVSPPAENWISYNGDYTGRRYSSLKEIDTANVARLKAQWVFHAKNSNRLEVTPVVVN